MAARHRRCGALDLLPAEERIQLALYDSLDTPEQRAYAAAVNMNGFLRCNTHVRPVAECILERGGPAAYPPAADQAGL